MKQELIKVMFDNEQGIYEVIAKQGISVEEVVFAVCVIMKCLERDKIISNDEFIALVKKYLTDPQYEEVQ